MVPVTANASASSALTRLDLLRVGLRCLFFQGLLHVRGMQNLSLMHALAPVVAKLDRDGSKKLLSKHLQFFNCNPNFAPLVAGGVLRLEAERLLGTAVTDQDVAHFKKAVSSPLAAMGDMLFMGTIKPMALTLACIFAIYNSFTGLVITWLLYNGVVVTCRLWGVYFGFRRGWEFVNVFSGSAFPRLLAIVQSIGASVGGALLAVVLYRAAREGTWQEVVSVATIIVAVTMLRRDGSAPRLALLLLPLCVLVALVSPG